MSGRIVLVDTNIFVSARNRGEAGYEACRRLLDGIDEGRLHALVSTISLAEVRAGLTAAEVRTVWQAFLSHLLTSPNYTVEPVDASIAEAAGELRSESKLTLPDALIVSTGHVRGAESLVTLDREIVRRQSLLPTRPPNEVI